MKLRKLLSLLLPEGMLMYFEIIDVEEQADTYILHIDERNIPPKEHKSQKLISKGFYEPKIIQDFPIRGKACQLNLRRRRWLIESSGDIVSRDWELVAKGTRMTQEFASFLKEID